MTLTLGAVLGELSPTSADFRFLHVQHMRGFLKPSCPDWPSYIGQRTGGRAATCAFLNATPPPVNIILAKFAPPSLEVP